MRTVDRTSNFGNPLNTTAVNPEVLEGWGMRPYDWQFGVTLQQEILPRVSLEISYNRRWWGNHFFTDNRRDLARRTSTSSRSSHRRRQAAGWRRLTG